MDETRDETRGRNAWTKRVDETRGRNAWTKRVDETRGTNAGRNVCVAQFTACVRGVTKRVVVRRDRANPAVSATARAGYSDAATRDLQVARKG